MLPERIKKSSKVLGSKHKSLIELQFNHVLNWKFTELAIEDYLYHVGYGGKTIAKQQYVADMIMFMERSFKGKYLNDERTHYQHITPKPTPDGDSLCEKLKRCKHKDSFNKRFKLIGADAILSRDFLEAPLDFKGKLYLRVLDTNRGNIFTFYRNDKLVDDFIAKALAFKKESMESELEKVWSREHRKYGVGNVESMESLSNTNTIQENNKKTIQGKPKVYEKILGEEPEGLVGIEKSKEEGKEQNVDLRTTTSYGTLGISYSTKNTEVSKITYNIGTIMAKSSFKGTGNYTAAEALEDTMIEEVGSYASYTQMTKAGVKELTPVGAFKIWRDSLIVHKLTTTLIRYNPITSKKAAESGLELFKTFKSAGYPATTFPAFIETIMREWSDLQDYLKDHTTWTKFDSYPNLGWLLNNVTHVLDWYKEKLAMTKLKEEKLKAKAVEAEAKALQKATLPVPNSSLQNVETIVQSAKIVKDKKATHSLGYTYMGSGYKYDKYGKENLTFEQNYAEAKQLGDEWMINMALESLKKHSIDLDASMKRVESLMAEASND